LVEKNVCRGMISGTFSRYFALADRSIVEVIPTPGGKVPRVGRVVAASDRPEVADATVEVEHRSRIGLQGAGQKPARHEE
jgi:hypothetical protein